jgi:hypothetical protein
VGKVAGSCRDLSAELSWVAVSAVRLIREAAWIVAFHQSFFVFDEPPPTPAADVGPLAAFHFKAAEHLASPAAAAAPKIQHGLDGRHRYRL